MGSQYSTILEQDSAHPVVESAHLVVNSSPITIDFARIMIDSAYTVVDSARFCPLCFKQILIRLFQLH